MSQIFIYLFCSNADLVVVACVTDPKAGPRGISLFVVEKGMPGFEASKTLKKLGRHASATCNLTFKNVMVPAENMIGVEGKGFAYLQQNLAQERLIIAISSAAAMRRALALTINYVRSRRAFGGHLAQFGNIQHTLAQCAVDTQVCTTFIDQCILQAAEGALYHCVELSWSSYFCIESLQSFWKSHIFLLCR